MYKIQTHSNDLAEKKKENAHVQSILLIELQLYTCELIVVVLLSTFFFISLSHSTRLPCVSFTFGLYFRFFRSLSLALCSLVPIKNDVCLYGRTFTK